MYFVFVLLLLVGIDFFINGLSIFMTSKETTWLFFFMNTDPSPYYGFPLWDLSHAPRWLSIVMGGFYVVFGSYLIVIQISSLKDHIKFKSHNKKMRNRHIPKVNIDKIPYNDKEWITEIKTRKQKGEKLNAYSKDGAAAARRKARALGIEECFVEFLSEDETKERRGW